MRTKAKGKHGVVCRLNCVIHVWVPWGRDTCHVGRYINPPTFTFTFTFMVASLCYCNNNYWAVSWTDCCNEIRPRRTSSLKGSLHLKPNTVKSNYFSPGNWGPQIFPTLPSLLLCNYTVLYSINCVLLLNVCICVHTRWPKNCSHCLIAASLKRSSGVIERWHSCHLIFHWVTQDHRSSFNMTLFSMACVSPCSIPLYGMSVSRTISETFSVK